LTLSEGSSCARHRWTEGLEDRIFAGGFTSYWLRNLLK